MAGEFEELRVRLESIAEELAEKRGGDDVTQPHTTLDRDDNLEGEPDSD